MRKQKKGPGSGGPFVLLECIKNLVVLSSEYAGRVSLFQISIVAVGTGLHFPGIGYFGIEIAGEFLVERRRVRAERFKFVLVFHRVPPIRLVPGIGHCAKPGPKYGL